MASRIDFFEAAERFAPLGESCLQIEANVFAWLSPIPSVAVACERILEVVLFRCSRRNLVPAKIIEFQIHATVRKLYDGRSRKEYHASRENEKLVLMLS